MTCFARQGALAVAAFFAVACGSSFETVAADAQQGGGGQGGAGGTAADGPSVTVTGGGGAPACGCAPDDADFDLLVVAPPYDNPIPGAQACVTAPSVDCCVTVDDAGRAVVCLPTNTEIRAQVTASAYYPVLVVTVTPAQKQLLRLPMVHSSFAVGFASGAGVTPDPTKGHVLAVAAEDKPNYPGVPGAVFALTGAFEKGPVYATANFAPDLTATSTLETGVAVFFNASPGDHVLSVGVKACPQPILGVAAGSAFKAPVDPGTISYVALACTP
jgi:hypothetical protein